MAQHTCPNCGGVVHREIARDPVRNVKTLRCVKCKTEFDVPITEDTAEEVHAGALLVIAYENAGRRARVVISDDVNPRDGILAASDELTAQGKIGLKDTPHSAVRPLVLKFIRKIALLE